MNKALKIGLKVGWRAFAISFIVWFILGVFIAIFPEIFEEATGLSADAPLFLLGFLLLVSLPLFISTLINSILFYRYPKLVFIFLPLLTAIITFIITYIVFFGIS